MKSLKFPNSSSNLRKFHSYGDGSTLMQRVKMFVILFFLILIASIGINSPLFVLGSSYFIHGSITGAISSFALGKILFYVGAGGIAVALITLGITVSVCTRISHGKSQPPLILNTEES